MSEMVERAAKAIDPPAWQAGRDEKPWGDWMDRQAAARIGARAALLAALDLEDQRIVDVMTGAKDGGRPDHDYDDDVRAMLRALRDYISQGASVE